MANAARTDTLDCSALPKSIRTVEEEERSDARRKADLHGKLIGLSEDFYREGRRSGDLHIVAIAGVLELVRAAAGNILPHKDMEVLRVRIQRDEDGTSFSLLLRDWERGSM